MYDFKCNSCEHVQTEVMSIARMESGDPVVCKECGGESHKAFTACVLGFTTSESLGRKKAPGDFRNFLSAVKKAHPGSAIKDH